jgi:hypothetical protein
MERAAMETIGVKALPSRFRTWHPRSGFEQKSYDTGVEFLALGGEGFSDHSGDVWRAFSADGRALCEARERRAKTRVGRVVNWIQDLWHRHSPGGL